MTVARSDSPFENSTYSGRFLSLASFRSLFLVFIALLCVFLVGAKRSSDVAESTRNEKTLIRPLVPKGTKQIRRSEFSKFLSSEYVMIPSSVEEIEDDALDGLGDFARIKVAKKNPYFQSIDGALLTKDDKTLIRAVVDSDGSTTVPNGTKAITENAFKFHTTIKRVSIPSSVEKIDYDALWQWKGKAFIEVAEDNSFFQSVDGSLLTKDRKELVYCPLDSAMEAVTPDGTKSIDIGAFAFDSSLRGFQISSSVEKIELDMFRGLDRSVVFEVAEDNAFFQSVAGSLLTKEDKTLIYACVDYKGVVVVPDGTKRISRGAFGVKSGVRCVWIPSSVEEIEGNALNLYDEFVRIEVAEENRFFKSVDGSLVTKDGKTLIWGAVQSDGSIVIPDGVKEFDYGAYDFNLPIKRVLIPSSVEEIPLDFFESTGLSARFEVSEENPFFQSVDGSLLTKEDKTLLRGVVDSDGALVVPDGTKRIFLDAFDFHTLRTRIWIPSSVEKIETGVFADMWPSVQIEVAEDSPFFEVVDGALLTKKDKTLVYGIANPDGDFVIPDGTKRLDEDVDISFWEIKRVLIPASFEQFGKNALRQFSYKVRYEVAKDNSFFKSVDGSLVTKDGKTLLHCFIDSDNGSAVVPDGTKKICNDAFRLATKLKRVWIPASVEEIEEDALSLHGDFARIEVAEENRFFKSVDGSLMRKDGVTLIRCFINPDNGSAVVPDGVKKLTKNIFGFGVSVRRVWIPSSVEEIEKDLLKSHNLSRFEVAEENPVYQSIDGSLLTKEGKTLLKGVVSSDGFVVVPDGTKRIDANAFSFQTKIKRVWIPSSVEKIERGIFFDLNSSTKIEVAEDNPFFEIVDGALLTKSDKTLLYGLSSLDGVVVIPNGTKKLDASACIYAPKLKRVLIPASFEEFGKDALYRFRSSVRFEVVKANPFFQSVDGSLMKKDVKTLLHCFVSPIDDSAVVPDGTKRISAGVVDNNSRIKSISIPSSVETINADAFVRRRPIIYGFSNSAAERFAKKYEFPFRRLEKAD